MKSLLATSTWQWCSTTAVKQLCPFLTLVFWWRLNTLAILFLEPLQDQYYLLGAVLTCGLTYENIIYLSQLHKKKVHRLIQAAHSWLHSCELVRCTLFCCPWVWGTFGSQLPHQTLISSEGRSDEWSPTCLPFTISSPAASSCLSIPRFQHSICSHCKSSSFCSNTGLQGTQCVDVQCRFNTWPTWIWFFGFGFVSPGRGNLNHSTSKDDTAF